MIHLDRANPVKLAISAIRARRQRESGLDSNIYTDKTRLGPVHITVEELRQGLFRKKRYEELKSFVQSLSVPSIHVLYEELLEELESTLGKIWEFLEVETVPTETVTRKSTPDDLSEAVSNLEELRAAFPEYEKFF